jgi:hypothetical protein
VRWFAAEYLIVVLGVLTAVALNAWWQGRQDAAREQVYLQQLAEDLRETERIMADRDSVMAARTQPNLSRLTLAFGQTPRPPRDSVVAWFSGINYAATPRPVLGTAEALVASGDFGAIADDSLRAAILRYLDLTREYMADQGDLLNRRDAVMDALYEDHDNEALEEAREDLRQTDILRRYISDADTTGRAASPDWQHPFPYDPYDILDDPAFFRKLMLYGSVINGLLRTRGVFRESAADLREQIEAYLDP